MQSYVIINQDTATILNNIDVNLNNLKKYQKAFTSELFVILDPESYLKKHKDIAGLNMIHKKTLSESQYSSKK